MDPIRSILAACAFVGLCGLGAAANQVLVVDPSIAPGLGFSSIQAAVNAANEGDTILIHAANYNDQVVIQGKALTLVGDPGPSGTRPSMISLQIGAIAANQSVLVRGVRVFTVTLAGGMAGIFLHDDQGPVILEDVVQETIGAGYAGVAGVFVNGASRVVFTRCALHGFRGSSSGLGVFVPARPALVAKDSGVFVYEGSIVGGAGADANVVLPFSLPAPSFPGAAGVDVQGGALFVSGAQVTGGAGGAGYLNGATCMASSDGGSGIVVGGAVRVHDSSVSGGAAGMNAANCPQVAVAGLAFESGIGTLQMLPGGARSLLVTTPSYAGQATTTTFVGAPGEPALLLVSFAPNATYVPALAGALIGALPLVPIALGTVPQSGEISFSVTLPVGGLPPGVDAVGLFEQVVVPGPSGNGLLSSPSAVVILK